MIESYFTDVPNKGLPDSGDSRSGSQFLDDVRLLSVGTGERVVRADESGIWAGGNRFAEAPFRVDMQGNLYTSSANGSVVIDTVNNRIVIYDENGIPVILIGYQENGF